MPRNALTGPHDLTPAQLLDFHRAHFGGTRMEATEPGGDEAQTPTPPENTGTGDGFPAETPIKDMSPQEQANYWKHKARRWETNAKDYDDVVAERDRTAAELQQLRQQAMTDAEKAVELARDEGRVAGRTEASREAALDLFKSTLAARGKDDAAISALEGMFNPGAYVNDKGALDHGRLTAAIDLIAPAAKAQGNTWPDMGQGNRQHTDTASVSSGRALYDARHTK